VHPARLFQTGFAAALGRVAADGDLRGNGRFLPSPPLAFRIARFFDVPAGKLFGPGGELPVTRCAPATR
jgi:hypothetical protein